MDGRRVFAIFQDVLDILAFDLATFLLTFLCHNDIYLPNRIRTIHVLQTCEYLDEVIMYLDEAHFLNQVQHLEEVKKLPKQLPHRSERK